MEAGCRGRAIRVPEPGGGRASGAALAISGVARPGGAAREIGSFFSVFFSPAVFGRCFARRERGFASGGGVWGPI